MKDFNGGSTSHGGGRLYNRPFTYEPYSQNFCRLQQDILDMTDLEPPADAAISDRDTALYRASHELCDTTARTSEY